MKCSNLLIFGLKLCVGLNQFVLCLGFQFFDEAFLSLFLLFLYF